MRHCFMILDEDISSRWTSVWDHCSTIKTRMLEVPYHLASATNKALTFPGDWMKQKKNQNDRGEEKGRHTLYSIKKKSVFIIGIL